MKFDPKYHCETFGYRFLVLRKNGEPNHTNTRNNAPSWAFNQRADAEHRARCTTGIMYDHELGETVEVT